MRVAVAAWVGSRNAGDEMAHAGLRRHLDDLGATAVVRSRFGLAEEVARQQVDALALGGGGLLQDVTSDANVPYHLAPVVASRVPVAGVGLGAGPLTTRLGRGLVRTVLSRPKVAAIAVRDRWSGDLLRSVGLAPPVVAADLAFNLPAAAVPVDDVLVVSLRPWTERRSRLPVFLRARQHAAPDATHVARAAAALDAAAARTGLGLRLVALEPPKDGPFLRAVAGRLRTPVEVLEPDPLDVPDVVGRGRVVVAMRYHAGVAAALASRPVVLLGYAPKVDGLGTDLDARTLPWALPDPAELAAAVVDALSRPADLLEERLAELQARERGNRDVLEQALSAPLRRR